ncbi:3-hydroxyacyl-CoA dehydrogenase family protein [Holdemania massiliensis]|uniref:3-hydroxyacyl-CoA dehydrogenase family protein n=1 Tax=Holdemania massiliensis TaxID=1468449 RepID=UPI003561961A
MTIQTITVIGANGTMGRNISGIFASFGSTKVYMVARNLEKAEAAKAKAALSVKAGSVANRLVAADYSMLETCVSESDLIFEAVFEDINIKKEVAQRVSKAMKPDAIACSGTSGLSITTLAEQYPEHLRSRFFGVHMFNPPYSLNLCELTPTQYSNMELCDELEEYLSKVLYRTVVKVKDSPAFLGNRIGFQFINEVMQYAEKYKYSGGIDYMDAILGCFSGRSMAPLVTADFVGLDIHKAIIDNLYENTVDYAHETFVLPRFAEKLIAEGKLGKKAGGGLYKNVVYDNGLKSRTVYDICSDTYRDVMDYHFPYAEKMMKQLHIGNYQDAFRILIENRSAEAELCLQFLLKYVIYSLMATEYVGYDIHSADDVMATGFNWCPPLAIADALGTGTDFKQLVRDRLDKDVQDNINLEVVLASVVPSKYDYRPFFKAKR